MPSTAIKNRSVLRPRRVLAALRLLTLGALLPLALPLAGMQAQSAQPWSIQASGLLANQNVNGGMISGGGVEAQLRYTPSKWSFGLGYQTSSHDRAPESLTLSGVFVEPRYALDVGSDRMAPYLAGRVGVLNESSSLKLGSTVSRFSSSGWAIGAGSGLLVRVTNSVNVDLGAAIVAQSLGDAQNAAGRAHFESFVGYIVKAGVSVGF